MALVLYCPDCGYECENGYSAGDPCPECDEPEICGRCNGSGEGMYDGTTCGRCNGSGVIKVTED